MEIIKKIAPFLYRRLNLKYDIVAPITATILVLISGTLISFLIAENQVTRNQETKATFLRGQQNLVADEITQRISAYEQTLISGASLFSITGDVSRQQWSRYIKGLNVDERFPGTDGLGFIERVPADRLDSFEERLQQEGFSGYSVYPDTRMPEYYPIAYIEPLSESNQQILGFNHYSSPGPKRTMEIARDSGKLALSPPLITQSESQQPIVVAYYPVYSSANSQDTNSRRQNLHGYTFVLLRIDDFGSRINERIASDGDYGLRITDVSDDTGGVLYTSSVFTSLEESDNAAVIERELPVLGRTWNIALALDDKRFSESQVSPFLVFSLGMVVNAIGAALLFMLMIHRQARIAVAHEKEIQQAKDDLLALASHQLRTPATGVKQYVGMVLGGYAGKISDEQRVMLEKADESNERQLEIINQLLYVAKADAGQLKVDPSKFDIVQVAKDVVNEQQEDAKAKKVKLSIRSKRAINVKADERHIRMIIENLVSNAVKYSYEAGKVEVYFSNWSDRVAVHVSDRGVGISENEMSQLFKKFSRIENKLTKRVGGSGIGLFLSQQLAQANGGDIQVESEPEKGSTFTLNLPKRHKK